LQIADHARDRKKASFITAALNTWVAIGRKRGDVDIPEDVLVKIFRQCDR
jgi:hypothetical protein